MNYGYGICSLYTDEHETPLAPLEISGGKTDTLAVKYEKPFSYLSTRSEDFSRITCRIAWTPQLRAPVEEGTPVGEQVYYLGEKNIGSCRILAAETVEKADFGDYFRKVWKEYLAV